MMSRSVPEWIGKSSDEPFPPRVRLRLFERAKGHCENCRRRLGPAEKWQADHRVAIIAGGENRESNGQILCDWCHRQKTDGEISEKSKLATIRKKHLGITKPKHKWPKRPMNPPRVDRTKYLNREE